MTRFAVGLLFVMSLIVSVTHGAPKGKEGAKENNNQRGNANEKPKGKPPGGNWSENKPGAPHGPLPHEPPHNQPSKEGAAAGLAGQQNQRPATKNVEGAAALNRNNPSTTGAEGVTAGLAASKRNNAQTSGADGAVAGAAAANRNSPKVSGVEGAAAGAAVANRNQPAVSGAAGAAAGAAAVRNSFNQPSLFSQQWYGKRPDAWVAGSWSAGSAWNTAGWGTVASYCNYSNAPTSYNYGTNVTCQGGNVQLNGQQIGTAEEFSQQAADLAQLGTAAEIPADTRWLPLGVFALVRSEQEPARLIVQIAIDKRGVVRGNYTDTTHDHTLPIHGAVDKQTQRLAWTVGLNTTSVMEVGLSNLLQGEAPALLHKSGGTDRWLLVRLEKPAQTGGAATP